MRIPLQTDDTLYLCTDGFYNAYEQNLLTGNAISQEEDTMNDDATCLTVKIK